MHDHDQGPDPEIPEYTPDVQKLEVGAVERVWPLEEPQEPLMGVMQVVPERIPPEGQE